MGRTAHSAGRLGRAGVALGEQRYRARRNAGSHSRFPVPGDGSRPLVLPAAEEDLPSGFPKSASEDMHWSNGPQPSLAHDQAVPKGGAPGTSHFSPLSARAAAPRHVGRSFLHLTSSLNVCIRIHNIKTPPKYCIGCQQNPPHILFGVDRSGSLEINDFHPQSTWPGR